MFWLSEKRTLKTESPHLVPAPGKTAGHNAERIPVYDETGRRCYTGSNQSQEQSQKTVTPATHQQQQQKDNKDSIMREMRIGRVTLQIRSNSSDPATETARLVDRFPITTDEGWASWKSQGHCGKPASAYSLYCDNHEHMHRNDDPMTPVIQAIDNRPGGRQRVVMCAHIKAPEPSNIVTPTPLS